MLKKLFVIALLCFSFQSYAQFGISLSFVQLKTDWDQSLDAGDNGFPHSGLAVSLDYWFRLRMNRIEFLPSIYYMKAGDQPIEFANYGILFNTNIYLLDFADDCNCPTFSKQNETFKKGFFFQISPGLGLWDLKLNQEQSSTEAELNDAIHFSIGVGMGMDIGISELLTITPLVRYRHTMGLDWEELASLPIDNIDSQSKINALEYSIRLGFRLDKKNYGYKKRRRY